MLFSPANSVMVRDTELRRDITSAQILSDRVSRQSGSARNLANGNFVTQRPSPDDTQKSHVDHSIASCLMQSGRANHMGQFSMKISAIPGSVLSDIQHYLGASFDASGHADAVVVLSAPCIQTLSEPDSGAMKKIEMLVAQEPQTLIESFWADGPVPRFLSITHLAELVDSKAPANERSEQKPDHSIEP